MIRTLLPVMLAALLEAGGDAAIRRGLQARLVLPIVAGGLLLLAYGLVVNVPGGSFGRLLGVYVAVFFCLAQVIDIVVFGGRPRPLVLAGGALIVIGGALVAASRP